MQHYGQSVDRSSLSNSLMIEEITNLGECKHPSPTPLWLMDAQNDPVLTVDAESRIQYRMALAVDGCHLDTVKLPEQTWFS